MAVSPARYLAACIGATVILLGAVAAVNYAVDPFGVYHYGKSWDWIHHRSGITHFLYAHKAHAVQEAEPDALILGSSRALYGLDPHNAALPEKTYNLGLEGADVYVDWRYLQHAAAAQMPKLVILALDIHDFHSTKGIVPEFSEDRLSVNVAGAPQHFSNFADLGATLLSIKALYYSAKSLTAPAQPNFTYDKGFEPQAMLKLQRLDLARNVFAANRQWMKPLTASSSGTLTDPRMMDAFGNIVAFCAVNHIRLIVLVQPLHASMTDQYTARWDEYSAWMKMLVAWMDHVPGTRHELWDFTGYEDVTTERFPQPTDTISHMQYFWECSHYQKKVGDMVLARILTTSGPANFGHLVTAENLQEDLDRIQAEKLAWHSQHHVVVVSAAPSTDQ